MAHIILLPKANYYAWVRAVKDYALRFHLNITSDPETAANSPYTVITVANPVGGYGRDILAWFRQFYPAARLDVFDVQTPDELAQMLALRVNTGQEFGLDDTF